MRMVADQMAATAEKARLIEDLRKANAALTTRTRSSSGSTPQLLEARRIKDEFLSNISHELRTPLTAVIGYISLMHDGLAGPINDEQRQTLGQVKDASEQLLTSSAICSSSRRSSAAALDAVVTRFDPRDPLRDAIAVARGRREQFVLDVDEPHIVPSMRERSAHGGEGAEGVARERIQVHASRARSGIAVAGHRRPRGLSASTTRASASRRTRTR